MPLWHEDCTAQAWRASPPTAVRRGVIRTKEGHMKMVFVGLATALAVGGVARADRCANDAAVAEARATVALACDCANAGNHGDYVSCVATIVNGLVVGGILPKSCRGAVTSCAAHSVCDKAGAETCCRVTAGGRVKCSVKKSADSCKPPRGGTACVGTGTSC